MSADKTIGLNNGIGMPMLGLGTYRSGPGEEAERAVTWALEAGYRLIDTALAYGNEPDVGRAVKASGVRREEIFITTKLENDDQGYDSTLAACERSLKNLQTDYIDLYLVHWPVEGPRMKTWKAMERLFSEGRCRAIGVSNYTERHIAELLSLSEVVPAVNQVEFHPFLYQKKLQDFCTERGIIVEAYSPLVKATRLDNEVLVKTGRRYGKTPAQILLRWHLEHGAPAVPKSVHHEWIIENNDIWDFSISEADMIELDSLDENLHYDWDPTDVP